MKIGTCFLVVVMFLGCKKDEPKELPSSASGLTIKGDDGTEITLGKDGVVAKSKDGTVVAGKDGFVARSEDGVVTGSPDGIKVVGKDGTVTINKSGEGAVIKGPDGQVIKFNRDGTTGTITGAHGSVSFGKGAAAKGFPLPVIDGAKVMASLHNDGEFTLTASVSTAAADVADFYEKLLKKKGLKVERNKAGPVISLEAKGEGIEVNVVCMQQSAGMPTSLTIVWEDDD